MATITIRERLSDKIEAFYEAGQKPADYPTLRASSIGDECMRRIWYTLLWVAAPKRWPGRMLRLFETGHREEDRIIIDLHNVGVTITRQQDAIPPLLDGWLTGHIDGVAENVPGAEKTPHLFEAKTHNSKSWMDWRVRGVKLSKPRHFAQMQIYMHALGLTRALYAAHNKDTDALEFERVEYDPVFAAQLLASAARLVTRGDAPPRISEKPDWFQCASCEFKDICHHGAFARRNCRTCIMFEFKSINPSKFGLCGLNGNSVSTGYQQEGCGYHLYKPDLVAGRQIDASKAKKTITYKMRDGSTFVDGAGW